jgi:hypothetical protein
MRKFYYPLIIILIDQIRNSTASNVSINDSNRNSTSVVGDYDAVLLLSHQIIPPKDFIPLFDAPPYNVMEGHVSARLPCNANSTSPLKIFISGLDLIGNYYGLKSSLGYSDFNFSIETLQTPTILSKRFYLDKCGFAFQHLHVFYNLFCQNDQYMHTINALIERFKKDLGCSSVSQRFKNSHFTSADPCAPTILYLHTYSNMN